MDQLQISILRIWD